MESGQPKSRSFSKALTRWSDTERLWQHEDQVVLVLTLIIGAVVGLVVVAFILLTENLGARMYPAGGAAWRRVAIPILGALSTGFLLQRYFPNARGSGIPQTKVALFIYGGVIRFKTVLGKFFCSATSLASGIALGREGPSVQVGAGIASCLGRRLGLSPAKIKSLVPIGSAAALAAAFNTPIAAVLFTLEEVMGDMHAPVLGSIVLSSATSWIVLHLVLGDEPLFHVPAYQLVHPIEFAFYAVLGVVGGLVSVSFVKLLLWIRKNFKRLPAATEAFQPTAGGLMVGIMGWFVPGVLGVGYGYVSQALNGELALKMMALLVVLKLVATATCYGSGNAGGIFGPSLFIGAMMGGAVGGWAHALLPDYTGSVGAYALVGMGAAFAGIIRVPLTSVIMIFEVTRDYSIIVPLMIANLISYMISRRLQEEPIYEALQHQDGIDLPSGAREREELRIVAQGMRPPGEVLLATETAEHAIATVHREDGAWPVTGDNGLMGMISMAQLEAAIRQGRATAPLRELLPPLDPSLRLAKINFPHVHADQPLDTAMRRMARAHLNVLPVVSRANLRELMGLISLQDVLAAYEPGKDQSATPPPRPEVKRSFVLLGGVLAALIGVIVVAGFMSYYYRGERSARAGEYARAGNQLMADRRYPEAVEQYRDALSISHSSEDRLRLAAALAKAGRFNEAEIYLQELLRADPNSGPANLGLARIRAQQGDMQRALSDYHRAIYGAWPAKRRENRLQARLELVETLGKFDRRKQAQAELMALTPELEGDAAAKNQAARLMLDFDLPGQSAELFQEILQKNKRDAEAYAGLGEAELALGNDRAAREAFDKALRLNPYDESSRKHFEVAVEILALDPTLHGLGARERYRRSRKLIEAVLGTVDQCVAAMGGQPPPAIREPADMSRKMLLNRGRPSSYSDAADDAIELAEKLWNAQARICGPPDPTGEPLRRFMARLAKKGY
jgi:CIC family chloride channel protein